MPRRDQAGPEAEQKLLAEKNLKHPVDPEEKGVYRNKLNMVKLTYKHLKQNHLADGIRDRFRYEEMKLVMHPTVKPNSTTSTTAKETESSK